MCRSIAIFVRIWAPVVRIECDGARLAIRSSCAYQRETTRDFVSRGVWVSAGASRALRGVAVAIVAAAVFGAFLPPMHLREVLAAVGGTLSDTVHVWTIVNGILTLVAMGFGAAALASVSELIPSARC